MITDVNVDLSRWPSRRVPGDETRALIARLRARGVTQAWAGSYDAILYKDIAAVNARLAADCRGDFLVPFGAVNPTLPDWQEDLRRCREQFGMPGIRLIPNYHGYKLTDPVFAELLHKATAYRLIVQIAVTMEDTRTQSRFLRAAPTELTDFDRVVAAEPAARVVLLNWPRGLGDDQQPSSLARARNVYFDIAGVEGIECIARLAEQIPEDRILFGSHSPFFCFESAQLKMRESGLSESRQQAMLHGNAAKLLA